MVRQQTVNAQRLREAALPLRKKIEDLRVDRVATTHKQQQQVESRLRQAQKTEWMWAAYMALAQGQENDTLSNPLSLIATQHQIMALLDRRGFDQLDDKSRHRLKQIGVNNKDTYQATRVELQKLVYEFLGNRLSTGNDAAVKAKHEALRLVGSIPGYYPTPYPIGRDVIRRADIRAEHRVLEPSCGTGFLLDMLFEAHPDQQNVTAVEIDHNLVKICHNKGYDFVIEGDFMSDECPIYRRWLEGYTVWYDRIIMNPPFEDGQDAKNIMRAHYILADEGRMVAICGSSWSFGNDKTSREFREFRDKTNAEVIQLPKDAFEESGVNVQTHMVIIDR